MIPEGVESVKLGTTKCLKDDTMIIGAIRLEDLNQDTLKNDYCPCSYSVELLERMITLVRAMEKYSEERMTVLVPKEKLGPLLVKSASTEQVYAIAPRNKKYFKDVSS